MEARSRDIALRTEDKMLTRTLELGNAVRPEYNSAGPKRQMVNVTKTAREQLQEFRKRNKPTAVILKMKPVSGSVSSAG